MLNVTHGKKLEARIQAETHDQVRQLSELLRSVMTRFDPRTWNDRLILFLLSVRSPLRLNSPVSEITPGVMAA